MDIQRLLSPSGTGDGDASTGNSLLQNLHGARPERGHHGINTPRPLLSADTSVTPTPRPTSSPDSPSQAGQTLSFAYGESRAGPNFRPLNQNPTSDPSSTIPASSSHDYAHISKQPSIVHRPTSTAQIDALADTAVSQDSFVSRVEPGEDDRLRLHAEITRTPTYVQSTVPTRPDPARNPSIQDIIMNEKPVQTPPPRSFESSALSDSESQTVTDLLSYLAEHQYAYESYVEVINLLHKGFLAHVSTSADSGDSTDQDPHDYTFLKDLRQIRQSMDDRFSVGEDIWVDCLADEMLLAISSEERISVTELYQKAVSDEPASVRLWQMYAGWISSNYAACNDLEGAEQSGWSDEDKEVCKDLFTRDMLLNVLEEGASATRWRIDTSHVLWNQYAAMIRQDLGTPPSRSSLEHLRNLYIERLQIPHADYSETFQAFMSLMSEHDSANWEAVMVQINELTEPMKHQMTLRLPHEIELRKAADTEEKDTMFVAFTSYLAWEKKHQQRSPLNLELRRGLYERALLKFPTHAEWWTDYVDFMIGSGDSVLLLPLIERATRHCPWSGDLWARRILQSDVGGKSRLEIEETKHRATNSGLVHMGGLEELVKVLQQWCSYLRRHAFSTINAEDDLDIADMGIASAINDIDNAGKELYGPDFDGDPLYRLEAVQIKFLTEARRYNDARNIYRGLRAKQSHSFSFWWKYYTWELWMWGYDRVVEKHRVETAENGPDLATAVVQEALSQRNLDHPEKILDMYLYHFQQHESGERLRNAMIDAREFEKQIATRRAKEAAEVAEASAQERQIYATTEQPLEHSASNVREKRKREDDTLPNGHRGKKTKTGSVLRTTEDTDEVGSAQIKRDREHNTVTLRNLPADVTELDVKKFFRQVGVPSSIDIVEERDGEAASATVEFASHDDVLAAKTRSGKELNGNEVRITSGNRSTLYVANYPPEYDEAAMRKLFGSYGEIVSVRFPSLKFNSKRRFCYVSFLTAEMAKAAEAALDDKTLDGSHRLLAKISDPDAKKQRSGAQAEGRELFVKNLDRVASDDDVKAFFEQYGPVISMNLVKLVSGKRTGTGFIVFASADDAARALDADSKPFRDRILQVQLASSKGRAAPLDRARREDVIVKQQTPTNGVAANGTDRRDSDISMTSAASPATHPVSSADAGSDSWKTARERKIALFNLPDTVNDARVRVAMEAHGPLIKIQMRRQDRGAIVEFATVQDAFNVRQGVDCSSLGPDVRSGDVGDLLAKVKKRQGGETGLNDSAGSSSNGLSLRPPNLSRPGQARGGRKVGGLGVKRGLGFGPAASGGENKGSGGGGAKSNADFRSMLEKSKGGAVAGPNDGAQEE